MPDEAPVTRIRFPAGSTSCRVRSCAVSGGRMLASSSVGEAAQRVPTHGPSLGVRGVGAELAQIDHRQRLLVAELLERHRGHEAEPSRQVQ